MCDLPKPQYIPPSNEGLLAALSKGDGYTINISWNRAYPDGYNYQVAYNIYYSTIKEHVFSEGAKFVSISPTTTVTEIIGLIPGETYFFAVRAFEYSALWYNLSLLPDAGSSKIYPEGFLLSNITQTSTSIPISDIDQFPTFGIVQIGYELIQYSSVDIPSSSLTGLTRGFQGTNIRLHNTDGYDGYEVAPDPLVKFWAGMEEQNGVIFAETVDFAYPNFARTDTDGYRAVSKDLLTTELGGSDEAFGAVSVADGGTSDSAQAALPSYDYAGWHRTDPVALLRGDCVGSYYGGQQYCADGYDGVGRVVRGIPIQVVNAQRQEILLNTVGEPVVLVRRVWTGIRCSCFIANTEYPENRCPKCLGTSFIVGWDQFYNPRRADGRILVRFSPTEDDLRMDDAGLESSFSPDAWTMPSPAIKDRDFLIRFNDDGTEEFRYEVLNVTRNKILLDMVGAQKLKLQRIRKTDPIYQVLTVNDTSTLPTVLMTSIGMVSGPGGIPGHVHQIVIPADKITSVSQINGTTSISQGHSHLIRNGVVEPGGLQHSHSIIFP